MKYQNNIWNLFKVNNKETRKIGSSVFTVNFEQISHIILATPLLILDKWMSARNVFYDHLNFLYNFWTKLAMTFWY